MEWKGRRRCSNRFIQTPILLLLVIITMPGMWYIPVLSLNRNDIDIRIEGSVGIRPTTLKPCTLYRCISLRTNKS